MPKLATLLVLAAGCADVGTAPTTTFDVTGQVTDSAITDVVAASPLPGVAPIAAPVGPDGSFDLALAPGQAWVVSFADARLAGADMLVATLEAGTLDVLVPQAAGALELGTIRMHQGIATPGVAVDEVVTALGLDREVAAELGADDDLATRVANPDVDNDGVLDALEPAGATLDVFGDLGFTVGGRDATIDDLVHAGLAGPGALGIHYMGTGIAVSVPTAVAPPSMASSTVTFTQPFYGSVYGPDTPVVPAGTPIGAPHVLVGTWHGQPLAAVVARPGHELPYGTYQFGVGDTALTFTGVQPPSDAALAAGTGLLVPFVTITPTDKSCTDDCIVRSLDLAWMRRDRTAWRPVTAAELAIARPMVYLDLARLGQDGTMEHVHVEVSGTEPSSSLTWEDLARGAAPDLARVAATDLCRLQVSEEPRIGMRLTTFVSNPSTRCAGER